MPLAFANAGWVGGGGGTVDKLAALAACHHARRDHATAIGGRLRQHRCISWEASLDLVGARSDIGDCGVTACKALVSLPWRELGRGTQPPFTTAISPGRGSLSHPSYPSPGARPHPPPPHVMCVSGQPCTPCSRYARSGCIRICGAPVPTVPPHPPSHTNRVIQHLVRADPTRTTSTSLRRASFRRVR